MPEETPDPQQDSPAMVSSTSHPHTEDTVNPFSDPSGPPEAGGLPPGYEAPHQPLPSDQLLPPASLAPPPARSESISPSAASTMAARGLSPSPNFSPSPSPGINHSLSNTGSPSHDQVRPDSRVAGRRPLPRAPGAGGFGTPGGSALPSPSGDFGPSFAGGLGGGAMGDGGRYPGSLSHRPTESMSSSNGSHPSNRVASAPQPSIATSGSPPPAMPHSGAFHPFPQQSSSPPPSFNPYGAYMPFPPQFPPATSPSHGSSSDSPATPTQGPPGSYPPGMQQQQHFNGVPFFPPPFPPAFGMGMMPGMPGMPGYPPPFPGFPGMQQPGMGMMMPPPPGTMPPVPPNMMQWPPGYIPKSQREPASSPTSATAPAPAAVSPQPHALPTEPAAGNPLPTQPAPAPEIPAAAPMLNGHANAREPPSTPQPKAKGKLPALPGSTPPDLLSKANVPQRNSSYGAAVNGISPGTSIRQSYSQSSLRDGQDPFREGSSSRSRTPSGLSRDSSQYGINGLGTGSGAAALAAATAAAMAASHQGHTDQMGETLRDDDDREGGTLTPEGLHRMQHQRRQLSNGSAIDAWAPSNFTPSSRESPNPAGHMEQRHSQVSASSHGEGPSNLRRISSLAPSWIEQVQQGPRPPSRWVQNKLFLHQSHMAELQGVDPVEFANGYSPHVPEDGYYDDEGQEYMQEDIPVEEEEEEQNEMNFFNPALLSHVSVQLRDRVQRGNHIKSGIAWPNSFTGRDVVTTVHSFMPDYTRKTDGDRRFALIVAQSLQNQLFFVEVDWDDKPLGDNLDDVFQFMSEIDGMGGTSYELPTGIETMVTKCYSPSCQGTKGCYAFSCPYRSNPNSFLSHQQQSTARAVEAGPSGRAREWLDVVDPKLLQMLPEQERRRQVIIHQAILAEEQYKTDLNAIETLFISPLRLANPPIVRSLKDLEELIEDLFGNILELREANNNLLEQLSVKEREDGGVINTIGDVYLMAAAEFRNLYPIYIGRLPRAEERLREELANNPAFASFLTRIVRQNESRRMDIKYLITRPSTQLSRYPQLLEAILKETPEDHPDTDFLGEAVRSIRNLGLNAQLKLWQASTGRSEPTQPVDPSGRRDPAPSIGDKNWHEFVAKEDLDAMTNEEKQLQETIWELIKGEMAYVADLRTMETVFFDGLRQADEPIIDRHRLSGFLQEVFSNYSALLDIHTNLLSRFHSRQEEQHPRVGAIGDLIYDAALNWQDAIVEYGVQYPKAKYTAEEERRTNPAFRAFMERCRSLPAVHKQSFDHFLYRPVPRLLRYPLVLSDILKMLKKVGFEDHQDLDTIPAVLELIGEQGRMMEKGVAVSQAKVELWQLPNTLSGGKFGGTVIKDLDLRNSMRELIHRGKVLRQPETTMSNSWSELHAFLFDNYFVLAKQAKPQKGQTEGPLKYYINRKPIPLELLTLGGFTDPGQSKKLGLLSGFRSSERHEGNEQEDAETNTVYPFTFSFTGSGQLGGQYTLWTESSKDRKTWLERFNHAKALRAAEIEANKVFELNPLSLDTFYASPIYGSTVQKADTSDQPFTGRVTCSVPFRTTDGRELVAIGCGEGVWIGLRSDPRSLRKVLHVKAVTQCAVLEHFSLFLVLSNKSLLAYPLEALVPSAQSQGAAPRGHQKLSDKHEVQYFACGNLSGRTLVVYLRKKGIDSVFRCLEPITGREIEDSRNRKPFGNLNLLNARNDWFRVYKDFFVPSEAYHVHFLRNKLIIVCARGFEIIDLSELNPGSIPVFDPAKVKLDPQLMAIKQRCENGARPLDIFRSTESEFLLCYDTFGFFVDRHGYPNRDLRMIEWEGRPETVAFHPPYVVLFSAPFMEIRHVSDGRLLQIYTASDIRCTWNGSGCNPGYAIPVPGADGYDEHNVTPEPHIHVVKRSDAHFVNQRRGKGLGQDVFELLPTSLLNNPLLYPRIP